jgi:plasmid maintenance system antidote protein VapI
LDEVEGFVGRTWREVEAFLEETGIGASVVGRRIGNDPNLIRHIRSGKRKLTLEMAARLAQFIAEYRENPDQSRAA